MIEAMAMILAIFLMLVAIVMFSVVVAIVITALVRLYNEEKKDKENRNE